MECSLETLQESTLSAPVSAAVSVSCSFAELSSKDQKEILHKEMTEVHSLTSPKLDSQHCMEAGDEPCGRGQHGCAQAMLQIQQFDPTAQHPTYWYLEICTPSTAD